MAAGQFDAHAGIQAQGAHQQVQPDAAGFVRHMGEGQLAVGLEQAQQGGGAGQQFPEGGIAVQLFGVQVGAAVAAGDGVDGEQGVLLRRRQAHQQVGLLVVRAVQPGFVEHRVGQQAARTAIARLAPEQRRGVGLQQGAAGGAEGQRPVLFLGQAIGDGGELAHAAHLALHAQAAADAADRPERIDPLLVGSLVEIDDLRPRVARQDLQVVAIGDIGGAHGSSGQQRAGKQECTHPHAQRISMERAVSTALSASASSLRGTSRPRCTAGRASMAASQRCRLSSPSTETPDQSWMRTQGKVAMSAML
ncbi:hypothetical protein D9M71_525300 [compost metagenome]